MLLPDQQSAVSRYSLRYLEMLRSDPDADPTQRLAKVQQFIDDYAAMMDARLIVTEDLEAALAWPGYWGELQVQRRIMERLKAVKAREQGFPVSDHQLIEWFGETFDPELLLCGLRHGRRE